MITHYDKKAFYRAHLTRDSRFDGKFFVAVNTTKIYCRPICPAKKAKLENLTFFIRAEQAEEAGYRPCLRCRPETAPGSSRWLGTSDTVRRAIRMMEYFDLETLSIKALAEKLGIGERWLRELFQQQLGTNPKTFLLNKKLNIARNLLDSTDLSITEIALSSGFNSIRRFNDAFKTRFRQTPRRFKQTPNTPGCQSLYLSYRPPLAWGAIMNFFNQRAIPSMERVEENTYQRLFHHKGVVGWMKATCIDGNKIQVDFKLNKMKALLDFVARIRALFDLDADPMLIEHDLRRDKSLAPFVDRYPGLRIPGCWDGFELVVRAIIGQKISVKAARTILIRLVNLCGEQQQLDTSLPLTALFPTPEAVATADLSTLGMTTAKVKTLKLLAEAVLSGKLVLEGTTDYEETCQQLLAIKGIGPWTVQYTAMRGLRDPNAFPETDLVIQKRIKQFHLSPKKWVPWRAYATILLFHLSEDLQA